MPKFKPQYRRLLFIDRKLKEGAYPNCSSLAAEWEVSGKTIQRDLDYLRDELDAPIAYDETRHGYYYTEPRFSFPAIQISESDLFAVCVAETVLSQFRHTPLFQKLSAVFRKIRDALPDKTAIDPAWLSERVLVFPDPATRVNPAIWDTLAKALRENRRVRIRHASPAPRAEAPAERIVDPYFLVGYKGEWYLNSYCHHRQAIRTFGVSRIARADLLDETFRLPAGMTARKMFGDQLGIVRKEEFHKVRIRFSPAAAPYIRERQWHPEQRIAERRDGGVEIAFVTNHLNEVKDWILSWGENARALAPAVLVDKVRRSLRLAAAAYARSDSAQPF